MGHVTSPSQGIFSSQERRGKSVGTRLPLNVKFVHPGFTDLYIEEDDILNFMASKRKE
jgi:hypothetical protein